MAMATVMTTLVVQSLLWQPLTSPGGSRSVADYGCKVTRLVVVAAAAVLVVVIVVLNCVLVARREPGQLYRWDTPSGCRLCATHIVRLWHMRAVL